MSTVSYDRAELDLDPDEPAKPLPRRPRRQFFNRRSAALVALITCAAGFYAGVRVEKNDVNGSSTLRLPSAATAALAGRSGAGGATGARSAAGTSGGAGAATGSAGARTGGFAGGAGGFAAGASVGTVASVNGRTLVLTETSGNTVKVRLTSSTKITKNQSASRSAVRPGDTIIVQGATNSSGTTVAGTVTDSGASAASRSSSSSTGSSSGASGASGVGSLFSGG